MENFDIELQRMLCGSNKNECEFMSFLAENRGCLPPFYPGHSIRELWFCDLPEQLKDVAISARSSIVGYKISDVFYLFNKNKKDNRVVEMEISTEMCFGNTWLYKKINEDGKPYLDKIARLLTAKSISDIPALQALKAGDKYICTDGNHRIYAAFLRKSNILVDCSIGRLQSFFASGEIAYLSE